jgi:hypothetical protein
MVREGGKAEGWREGGREGGREADRREGGRERRSEGDSEGDEEGQMGEKRDGRRREELRHCSRKGVKFDEYEESGEGRKD